MYPLKAEIADSVLLNNCPRQWCDILQHLRLLSYKDRPDYFFIYNKLCDSMEDAKSTFADPFEWEVSQRAQEK